MKNFLVRRWGGGGEEGKRGWVDIQWLSYRMWWSLILQAFFIILPYFETSKGGGRYYRLLGYAPTTNPLNQTKQLVFVYSMNLRIDFLSIEDTVDVNDNEQTHNSSQLGMYHYFFDLATIDVEPLLTGDSYMPKVYEENDAS